MRKVRTTLIGALLVISSLIAVPAARAANGPDPGVGPFDITFGELQPFVIYGSTHFEVAHPTGWDWGWRHAYVCAVVEHFTNSVLDFEVHYELFTGYPTPLQINDTSTAHEPVNGFGPCGDGIGDPAANLVYSEAEYGDHHPHSDVENTGDLVFYKDLDGGGFVDDIFERLDYDDPDNCGNGYWTPGNSPGEAVFWWDTDGPQESIPGVPIPCPNNGPTEPFPILVANVHNAAAGVGYCVEDSMDGDLCTGVAGTITGTVTASQTGLPLAGAAVSYSGGSTTTNASGVYTLPANAGTYNVTASAAGYTAQTLSATVISGRPTQQGFSLAPVVTTGAMSGIVTAAESGSPIAGATVSYSGGSTTTDGAGAYSLLNVAPGTYQVSAAATDRIGQTLPVTVSSGQTAQQNFILTHVPVYGPVPGSQGPIAATSGVTQGTGAAWSSPNNITGNDTSTSNATLGAGAATSAQLRGSFPALSVPTDATITGIEIKLDRFKAGSGQAKDLTIQLVKSGVTVGSNKANTSLNWPTVDTTATYGSSSDLWGTTWTVAEVNSGLGVVVATQRVSGSESTRVDYVTVTVYYTVQACIQYCP